MRVPDSPQEPTEFDQALGGLIALIATGPAPDRVVAAIGAIVAGWADEPDMSDDVMAARVEQMWDGFSTDASELQAQLADTEGAETGAVAKARRVLAALEAAVGLLARIQR